jgi:hypothetical protein
VRQVVVGGDLAQHRAVTQINERKRREFEIVHERSRPRHAHEGLNELCVALKSRFGGNPASRVGC